MDPLKFRKHQHIRSGADFERVFRQGSRARSDLMVVCVRENGLEHSRLGLSVGKRIWKSAVKRNRIRRIFRESFRLSQYEIPAGLDVVLIPGRPKLDPDLPSTCEQLIAMTKKAYRRYLEKVEKAG
ncbi:MAG: ribonuclease P protein component [Planctomycetota bacterium]|jgi:ribonuclease P protein component